MDMFSSAILAVAGVLAPAPLPAPPLIAPPAASSPPSSAGTSEHPKSEPPAAAAPETDVPGAIPTPGHIGLGGDKLDQPVQFKLINGLPVRGRLTSWGLTEIDGSFAVRRWEEIAFRDTWRLGQKLIDRRRPEHWVLLGHILLRQELDQTGAADFAERAFGQAVRIARGDGRAVIAQEITGARTIVAIERASRAESERAAEAERIHRGTPESQRWTSTAWPLLQEDEQAAANLTLRDDARKILERVGASTEMHETEHFLLAGDLPRNDAARWGRVLERMYDRLCSVLGSDADENIFWGRAVILVYETRDRFELAEVDTFQHVPPPWMHGVCHPVGPKVFVNATTQPDDHVFGALLVHEAVHGFMHRYRSPARLPAWANEGFADVVSELIVPKALSHQGRRERGLRFIRSGAPIAPILDLRYDVDWPGPEEVGYGVGALTVELMMRDQPMGFRRWVNGIKSGVHWEEALRTQFGTPRDELETTTARFYFVND